MAAYIMSCVPQSSTITVAENMKSDVLILLLFVCFTTTVSPCEENSLRLIGGYGSYEGNVQICRNDTWGYVCSNSWGADDAKVVCRQLGYSFTNAVYRISSYYGFGKTPSVGFWLDYVHCKGNEKKLVDCPRSFDIGVINSRCWAGTLAGVFCPGGSCAKGDVRLATFYPNSNGRSEGRIEVCYNNKWGTVCTDRYWDTREAQVTCRQLGFGGSYYHYRLNYGAGIGSVWLDRSNCRGSESQLFDCSVRLNDNHCNHNQDAGIRCIGSDSTACVNGQFRLWSAYDTTPKNEGVLQSCVNGRWYTVCDISNCYVGRVACISLGYDGLVATRANAGYYYGYYSHYDNYHFVCRSRTSCYRYGGWWWYRHHCGNYYRSLGVTCLNSTVTTNKCGNGDVQLVDGETKNEGRVEYCHENQWAPVCSITSQTAHLMCKKLGYTRYNWGKVISKNVFGRTNKAHSLHNIECSSSATDLSSCQIRVHGGGCYSTPRPCDTEFALRCFEPGECNDGQIRLMNGTIEQEGRPEICVNGVWSSICAKQWSQTDGYTFCKQLGYDGPNPIVYSSSEFGDGIGPVIWSNVYCGGWESGIFDCTKSVYPSFTCYDTNIAGVTCKEWCTDGDVRLVGGDFDNEGTVEVCFDNLWGQISDAGWSSADAKVVCNELGHTDGLAKPVSGSFYGSAEKVIHLKDVACLGDEDTLADCTKIQLPLHTGKLLVEDGTTVAGVDCIFDIHGPPTKPPCIDRGEANPIESCAEAGKFRLVNGSTDFEGRVEYCYNKFWTPLCVMDNKVAKVACKELGLTQYSWGSVFVDGEYGNIMNYSVVDSITCSGSETQLSQCIVNTGASCLAWCPDSNIGLKCFDSTECKDGAIRLNDGIIEQEGRVEVCVNGVWGSVCDKGWDKADAHVACKQLGLSESEPIIFLNSHFGGGNHPIVYSNLNCGGWQESLGECDKDEYLEVNCTKNDVAGVFCGYDCKHGDVRLVGGSKDNEGTVETCLNNLWGLINEAGWSTNDANVVCRELGYEAKGTVAVIGSHYGKPNKPVLVTDVLCDGDENSLSDCIQKEYSFHEGRVKLNEVEVAGVKCFDPNMCVSPPDGGDECSNGALRLTGKDSNEAEGRLEYCYKGLWSKFCTLGEKEAAVACNQLGFSANVASVYLDGRYNLPSDNANSSLFLNFTCSDGGSDANFSTCTLNDTCRSTCSNAIGIECYTSDECTNGQVRLASGGASSGRVEVCYEGIWGSVCGKGFDHTDAYVVCKELGRGVSEPSVSTSSAYGDGSRPIVYGDIACKGYENNLKECSRKDFGEFKCFHNNTVGIICQDNCNDADLRLMGGKEGVEGTVEVCYDNLWGMVTSVEWDDKDAEVVCYQMGYYRTGALAFTNSEFGKPEKTIHLNQMKCKGNERLLEKCSHDRVALNEGENLYKWVEVAGVQCNTTLRPTTTSAMHESTHLVSHTMAASTSTLATIDVTLLPGALDSHLKNNATTIGVSMMFVVLILVTIIAVIAIVVYFKLKWKKIKATRDSNAGDAVHLHNIYDEKEMDAGIYGDEPQKGKLKNEDLPPITGSNIYEEKVFNPGEDEGKKSLEEDYY